MKTLLAILLLSAVSNSDAATFVMGNEAGGQIVLKTAICTVDGKQYKNLGTALSYASDGRTIDGCWNVSDNLVQVLWFNGEKRVYPASNFTQLDEKEI